LEEMRTSSEGQLRMQLQELEQQLKERDATIRDLATSQAQLSHTAGSASQALQNELERLSMERWERHHVETEKQSLEDEKKKEMDEKPSGIEAESQSLKVQAIDDKCEMQDGPAMEVPSINDATRQEDEQRSNEDLKDLQSQDLEVEEVHEGIGQALDKDEAAMESPVPAIPEAAQPAQPAQAAQPAQLLKTRKVWKTRKPGLRAPNRRWKVFMRFLQNAYFGTRCPPTLPWRTTSLQFIDIGMKGLWSSLLRSHLRGPWGTTCIHHGHQTQSYRTDHHHHLRQRSLKELARPKGGQRPASAVQRARLTTLPRPLKSRRRKWPRRVKLPSSKKSQ